MNKQRSVHNIIPEELGTIMFKNNSKGITLRMRLTSSLTLHPLLLGVLCQSVYCINYGHFFGSSITRVIFIAFTAFKGVVITKNVVIHFCLQV